MLFPKVFQRFVGVLDHDDGGIDHGANRDRDAAERHDVARQMRIVHGNERREDRNWQRDDRDQRGADVPEKYETDQGDDDAFLDQFLAQRCDRTVDQLAAIIGRHDSHPGWQRRFDVVDLAFDAFDHAQRVLAVTHDHNASDNLAFAVELRYATT